MGWAGPGPGLSSPRAAKAGPEPFPLAKEAEPHPLSSSQVYNLGTGTGYSVLQMVQAMEKASGREVRSDLQPAGLWHTASCCHARLSVPWQPLCCICSSHWHHSLSS